MRSTRDRLIWVLVIAVVIRVAYAVGAWLATRDPSVFIEQDTESYVAPAREMLANGTFTVAGVPELQRTPGYPLLLVIGLWLGALVPVTIAIQILLSAVTTLGVVVIANRLTGDRRIATIAGILYAFEPIAIGQASALGTETLCTTFVVWALALFVEYVRDRRPSMLLGGVTLLSVATYVRPAGYYLPFGVLGVLAVGMVARRDWRQLTHLAIAGVLAVGLLVPWHIRNRALDFRGFSAITAVNMYFYNAAAVEAVRDGKSYGDVQTALGYRDGRVYLQQHPDQRSWSPGRRFTYMGAEGSRIVKENVLVYARLHVQGMLRVVLDPGALSLLQPYGLYAGNSGVLSVIVTQGLVAGVRRILQTNMLGFLLLGMLGLLLVITYAFALRGSFADRRVLDPAVWLLVLTVGYFIVVAGGPVGVGRFRHPAMPFVCVLAAIGLTSFLRARRHTARTTNDGS